MFFKRKKKVSVQIKSKIDPELALWQEMNHDAEYKKLLQRSAKLHEEIQADYSVLHSIGISASSQTTRFVQKCKEAISTVEALIPYWKKYNQPLPTMCEPAKRLAMVYEQLGQYDEAAKVCLYAISMGCENDGTSGGMWGRLAQQVKKGKLQVTPEIEKVLSIK